MLCKVRSMGLQGVSGYEVQAECDLSSGLPAFDVVGLAAKPLPFGYLRAVKKLGFKRKNVAIVGDQIFTDIMGGRLAGVKTVLVTDITPEDKTFFKIKRYFERKMLKRWKNER